MSLRTFWGEFSERHKGNFLLWDGDLVFELSQGKEVNGKGKGTGTVLEIPLDEISTAPGRAQSQVCHEKIENYSRLFSCSG